MPEELPSDAGIIFDDLGIAYKTPAQPFDADRFLELVSRTFQKKQARGFTVSQDGVLSQIESVYLLRNARLNFDPDSGIVGVAGKSYGDVSEGFGAVDQVLRDELHFDLSQIISLEINAKGRFQSKTPPISRLEGAYSDALARQLSTFFKGDRLVPLTIRMGSQGGRGWRRSLRELPDWTEIRLEPFTVNPVYYYWELVFRRVDSRVVMDLWQGLPDKLRVILGMVG